MHPWQLNHQVLPADDCGKNVSFRAALGTVAVSCLHLLPLFLRLCSCHTMKSFLQHDLDIVFHPWVTKFVHLQFLRLGTFPLGRRLECKGDFAVYQPMISVAVCTGHHCGVVYISHVMLLN